MQEDNHVFQGLRRDNHQIRQDAKFLWDAHNIRITNREDNTLLSITNEKGTSDSLVEFQGYYVGHCVLGKYLVVFTATIDTEGNSTSTHIYRVEKTNLGYDTLTLYEDGGQLNISPKFPIEALGSYENDAIQKVYWVDGRNQPRVINIMKTDGGYNPELLGFVPILNLDESVEVTKNYGTGVFAPGVIQYAFTYYKKYGQESNIFLTTPLQYLAPIDRGANPEDKVANSFTIVLKGIDKKFDFLRVYSIHRTSIDAIPTVLRVVDLPIENKDTVTYTDSGTTGDTVDPTQLLYIGGEQLVAHCITTKDNTLFLGNIEQDNSDYLDVASLSDKNWSKATSSRSLPLEETSSTYFIKPHSMISYEAGFKTKETYRCGWQYQLQNGKWSSPIFLEDTVLSSTYPWEAHSLISKKYTLNSVVVDKLLEIGAKRVRPCVVFPTTSERTVLCQGILCPTIYQYSSRKSSSPYAMSSWYFRPAKGTAEGGGFDTTHIPPDIEYLHNKALATDARRGAEIQNMYSRVDVINGEAKVHVGNTSNSYTKYTVTHVTNMGSSATVEDYFKHTFFIDENIVTFHSPDIELDTTLQNSSMEGLKLNIIGVTCLKGTIGDISLQTSSPAWKGSGFERIQVGTLLSAGFKYTGGLVTTPSYIDHAVPSDHNTATETAQHSFLVYPWHRSGSMNDDQRGTVEGKELTRTAVLETKKICNFKVFSDNTSFGSGVLSYGITTPQLWNSSELQVLQVETGYSHKRVPYYGNADIMSTAPLPYPIYFAPAYSSDIATTGTALSTDPVRIKYKSTPHLVFSLESDPDHIISKGFDDYTGPAVTILPKNESLGLGESDFPASRDSSSPSTPAVTYEVSGLFKTSANSGVVANNIIQVIGIDSGYILSGLTKQSDGSYKAYLMARDGKNYGGFPNWTSSYYTFQEKMKNAIFKISSGTLVESGNALGLTASNYDTTVTIKHQVNSGPVVISAGAYEGESVYLQVTDIYNDSYGPAHAWALLTLAKLDTPTVEGGDGDSGDDLEEEGSSSDTYPISVRSLSMVSAEVPYLLIGELVREGNTDQKFGGPYILSKTNNMWYPAGDPVVLPNSGDVTIDFQYGDTWYSRYDCLKTYPFTQEDENSIIEIGSFLCETRVNIDGRYDRNRNKVDNLNVTPQIFNLVNEVYTQKDNFFNYRILEDDAYRLNKFANQVTWSLEKTSASDTDPWTNITLANTLDMDGEKGKVTALRTWNEYLLCFQEKALSQILFNSRVQIPTTDGVPIEISNGYKVDGSRLLSGNIGCSNKWATTTTTTGIYFLDSNTDSLYIFNGQLANLSEDRGMDWWVRQNHTDKVWNPIYYRRGVPNGVRAFYDNKYGDIYFTPGPVEGIDQPDALCYSEQLGQFTSLMSYGGTQAMFNFADGFYSLRETDGNVKLYQNNVGDYNDFYGTPKGWSFSFISNQNPTLTKIFDTIDLRTDHYWTYGTEQLLNSCPMNYMEVDNEYQHSGTVLLDSRNMRKKFRVWRGLLPRNKGTRQRIRNPWSMITLGWNPLETTQPGDNTKKAVVHDVSVKYTV